MRPLPFFLLFLTLAASCVLEDKPVDPGTDAGTDSGPGSCTPACSDDTPICNTDSECVACTPGADAYCTDQAQVCKTEGVICVDCNTSAECDDPEAAHCAEGTNECKSCEGDTDCDNIDGLARCEAGTCVECTPANETADCPGTSCDPRTFACTETDVGTRETCETCVADSECGEEGNRCVLMEYEGQPYPDLLTGFCLKTFGIGDPCEQPYLVPLLGRTSLSGPPTADYCGVNEGSVTCPAVLALLNNVECATGEDDECPTSGLCRDFAGGLAEDRCTYSCSLPAQCPSGEPANTCGSSGSGGDDYCGG